MGMKGTDSSLRQTCDDPILQNSARLKRLSHTQLTCIQIWVFWYETQRPRLLVQAQEVKPHKPPDARRTRICVATGADHPDSKPSPRKRRFPQLQQAKEIQFPPQAELRQTEKRGQQ